jgi:hypothetical protein
VAQSTLENPQEEMSIERHAVLTAVTDGPALVFGGSVVRRLVEKCCAKRDRGRDEESTCDRNQAWIVRDAIDDRMMHQMASAGSTAIDRLALKCVCDARDLSSGQY